MTEELLGCVSIAKNRLQFCFPETIYEEYIHLLLPVFPAEQSFPDRGWHSCLHFGSVHIDATLYTDSDFHPSCKVTAMNCFLLELRVILHEYSDVDLNGTIENLMLLANSTLSSNKNLTEYGCKECEELEEKSFTEFLQSFKSIVQMFINTS
ncbi:hypothetical protein U0070_009212 [Myodes glareolus]|uniref:Interleukin n=1 Tax=Myodes glareolus TaxID=447135 RepID=A0AAW0HJ02_MYOGA